MQAYAVDFHPSDESAYGRVTNPGRYQVVVDSARAMIDELVASYDVDSTAGVATVDFPDFHGPAADVVQLHPSDGASMAFMFTDFPGVLVRAGGSVVAAFPACGCDACDESPTDVIERLEEFASAVVEGRVVEELTKRTLSHSFAGGRASTSREKRFQRGEWKQHGSLGSRRWSAWIKRN